MLFLVVKLVSDVLLYEVVTPFSEMLVWFAASISWVVKLISDVLLCKVVTSFDIILSVWNEKSFGDDLLSWVVKLV